MSAEGPWTIQRILGWTQGYFAERGIDTPRLDAEILLAQSLGCERIYLYTHFDQPLSEAERTAYRALVKRRAAREPVAYIVGSRGFFGRDFRVTPAVLIPRPETEHLIEETLGWVAEEGLTAPRILDIGSGSGCIAVTLAAELPAAQVTATDIAAEALEIARSNAERHGVAARIRWLQGDLFAPLDAGATFDVIVANPPYVEATERATLMPEVRDHEPAGALFAGDDGLSVISALCGQVAPRLAQPGLFLCEHGATQHDAVVELLGRAADWRSVAAIRDLQGHRRAVAARR